jgi:hypothetical protein
MVAPFRTRQTVACTERGQAITSARTFFPDAPDGIPSFQPAVAQMELLMTCGKDRRAANHHLIALERGRPACTFSAAIKGGTPAPANPPLAM